MRHRRSTARMRSLGVGTRPEHNHDSLPMLVRPYLNTPRTSNPITVTFTREQASAFAKEVADDFNPLHNIDAKRFCVPGDLLFAMVLSRYGVTRHMRFVFSGMVTDETELVLPDEAPEIIINGANDKEYLRVEHTGENSRDETLIDNLIKSYVTFSGHTFPHILIPLMQEQNVMINPDRPMVMYESMLIDLERLDMNSVQLQLDEDKTRLGVNGKRGNVCLAFNLTADGETVGRGEKHMLVSGLRPFEKEVVDQVIEEYNSRKQHYQAG